jgi:hypothetical protein
MNDECGGRHVSKQEEEFLNVVEQWAKRWSENGVSLARYRAVSLLLASVDLSMQHMTVFEATDTLVDYRRLVDDEFGWRTDDRTWDSVES